MGMLNASGALVTNPQAVPSGGQDGQVASRSSAGGPVAWQANSRTPGHWEGLKHNAGALSSGYTVNFNIDRSTYIGWRFRLFSLQQTLRMRCLNGSWKLESHDIRHEAYNRVDGFDLNPAAGAFSDLYKANTMHGKNKPCGIEVTLTRREDSGWIMGTYLTTMYNRSGRGTISLSPQATGIEFQSYGGEQGQVSFYAEGLIER